jgi:hypothetical protein
MAGRLTRVLCAGGSVLVTLVLAHSIVFLLRYGSAYGEALAHNGHDVAWTIAVVAIAVLGAGLAIAGLFQLSRLGRAASETWSLLPAARAVAPAPGRVRWLRRWVGLSARLAAVTGVLLTVQENVERAGVGLPAPGPTLLLSEQYPWALPIVFAVSFAVGLVVALFRWRRDALLARLRSASQAHPRTVAAPRPNELRWRPAASVLAWERGLRAPPISFDT